MSPSGSAKLLVKGGATTVLAPPPGSTLGLPVTVQLVADDACYGATFPTASVNAADLLKAKNGQ